MKYLDLFSGIGGMALAAQWAGFELMGFAEIEPYCCKILAQHWPGIKNYGDIRRADFSELQGNVELIGGGFPCQPFSAAGKRRGSRDDRNLWPAMRSIIEFIRPAWCICENVPGLLSMGEFDGICDDLENLGYQYAVFNVSANAVGAKHRRERVFIVAHAERERRDGWSEGRETEARAGASAQSGRSSQNAEPLADTESGIRQWEASRDNGHATQCGEALADTDRAGLEEHESRQPGQLAALVRSCGSNGNGKPFAEFLRMVNGFSPGLDQIRGPLDGNQPQMRMGDAQTMPHPLTTERIPHRSHRLKALGNACVPKQCLPFFLAIAEVERCHVR